jgi:hypothetical protein
MDKNSELVSKIEFSKFEQQLILFTVSFLHFMGPRPNMRKKLFYLTQLFFLSRFTLLGKYFLVNILIWNSTIKNRD